jgi:hypothetical protein
VLLKQDDNTAKLAECRWASFYLVIGLIKGLCYLRANLSLLPTKYWLMIAVYVTGLITQENVTTTAIATTVGIVSHDQLNRMLQSLSWGLTEGAILSVRFVIALGIEGYLIIDDVLIPKPFASKIAFCFWDHDHSNKRHVFGQRLVFVVWSNGWLTIPLLFAFWQKGPSTGKKKKCRKGKLGRKKKRGRKVTDYSKAAKRRRALYRERKKRKVRRVRLSTGVHYRSKNELARSLVWKLVRRGIRTEFILFDNWYASAENLALFERLGFYWVTRAKENANVYYDEEKLSVREVAGRVKKTNYHYYDALRVRARSFQVTLADRLVKLTVIKDDTAVEAGRTKYLMTNALHLTNQEHILWYRARWSIEVFFRDCKQYLGLAKCEARTTQAVISHVGLVCIAYIFLQLLKPVSHEQRPSIRVSKNALAPLMVVVDVNWHIVRQKPTAELESISYQHLWNPVRTGFLKLPCPELIDLT